MPIQRKALDVREGIRKCIGCREEKSILEFHKNTKCGILGRRAECKECRNDFQYQRIMEKKLEEGAKHVIECENCGRLYCKNNSRKVCVKCLREQKK